MTVPRLGRVQLRIMEVLWEKGRSTAREITDALNRSTPIAHSTVQTLLRKLEKKGAVNHETDDRTFVFCPLVRPDSVRENATREFIDRLFGGSPAGLVSYLLKHEHIPDEELLEIGRLIGGTKHMDTSKNSNPRKNGEE
ncbi:MAG: BlaI/MecI/CopY family transcriptional regulator [bacterium]